MPVLKIAVAIPTFNREQYLAELIGTIPLDWDIYVSDNNSSLIGSNKHERAIYSHSEELIPMFSNWNRAISLVKKTATHVFVPSDDDLYLPLAQETVENAISKNPDADLYIFGCDYCDELGNIWDGYCPQNLEIYPKVDGFFVFAYGVKARMPGILFRKKFLEDLGAFDESFALTAADSELIQRALLFGKSVFVPNKIGLYRIWSGSLTHQRVASDQWMHEIDQWVDKIGSILSRNSTIRNQDFNILRYKDEIYIANMRSGVQALKQQRKYFAAWKYVFSLRYPYSASLFAQVKLFVHLLLPF